MHEQESQEAYTLSLGEFLANETRRELFRGERAFGAAKDVSFPGNQSSCAAK